MNVPLMIIGLLKILLGIGFILLSVHLLTEWILRNAEDPYEWEKRMKEIFCDKQNLGDKAQ